MRTRCSSVVTTLKPVCAARRHACRLRRWPPSGSSPGSFGSRVCSMRCTLKRCRPVATCSGTSNSTRHAVGAGGYRLQVDQLLPQAQAIAAALAVVGPLAGGGPSVGVDVQRLGRHPDAQGRRLQESRCPCPTVAALQGQTELARSQRLEAGDARRGRSACPRPAPVGGFDGQRQIAVGEILVYRERAGRRRRSPD